MKTLKEKRNERRLERTRAAIDDDTAKAYSGVSRVKALLIKARTSVEIEAPKARENLDSREVLFAGDNVITPDLDPESLLMIAEQCGVLSACVQAMAVNVHGFGYTLKPVIDLDAKDADRRIAATIQHKRLQEAIAVSDVQAIQPLTDDEIKLERERLKSDMDSQRAKLRANLEAFAGGQTSLSKLRRQLAVEREVIGWSSMELTRNITGKIARGSYVPGWTIRATELDEPVEVDEVEYVTDIHTRRAKVMRRFRRYVQRSRAGMQAIWFKEIGDPRVVSRITGKVYRDQKAFDISMSKGELKKDDGPASEIWYDPITWPRFPTGMPRWSGVLPAVLGLREEEETNLDYFANNSIPPLMILVNGGVLSRESSKSIADYLKAQGHGRQLMHRTLILEAIPADSPGAMDAARPQAPAIKVEPLRQLQLQDALFQGYDERNTEKIGQAFRLPPLIYGGHKDFNRATADAQLYQCEKSVFAPERQDWDTAFNRLIVLNEWGVTLWRVVSNSPIEVDAETRIKLLVLLSQQNAITPAEIRQEAGTMLGRDDLDPINEYWQRVPPGLALMGVTPMDDLVPTKTVNDDQKNRTGDVITIDAGTLRALVGEKEFDEIMSVKR
jgi:PBSX family phage portal protein